VLSLGPGFLKEIADLNKESSPRGSSREGSELWGCPGHRILKEIIDFNKESPSKKLSQRGLSSPGELWDRIP